MAEDTPARLVSPQADLETTPLLFEPPVHCRPSGESGQNRPPPVGPNSEARPRAPKSVIILTSLSLFFSIITLVLTITINIIDAHHPPGYYLPYEIEWALRSILAWMSVAAIFSILNCIWLRRRGCALPLWLNLILDPVACFYVTVFSLRGLCENFDGYSSPCYPRWHEDFDKPTCDAFAKRIKVLVGFTMGFGLALAVVHLILFLMRCVFAFRTRFWQRPWHFPTGQLTVEFTVKLLRQENTER